MARSEARISVDIWDDADFCALSPGAQRMYAFLVSQRDLAHDGVLALRERRWARSAAGLTADQITSDLDELEHARFVVVDFEAEELLVRSLIRRDKIFRQPNVFRAAADHLEMVSSRIIREALAVELARVADEPMPEGSRTILDEMRAALPNPSGNPSPDPSEVPTPEGSDNPSEVPTRSTPGERGVVTVVSSTSPYPEPRSPDPVPRRTPPESESGAPAPTDAKKGHRLPDDFEPDSELIEWAREHAPTTSRADHEQFVDYWRGVPGAKGRKVDWRATWRTWMRREHERRAGSGARASPTSAPRPSTTDQRVQAALDAGARVQAQLDQQLPLREIAA